MLDKAKNKGEPKPYLRNLNVRWFAFDLSDVLEMRFLPEEAEEMTPPSNGDVLNSAKVAILGTGGHLGTKRADLLPKKHFIGCASMSLSAVSGSSITCSPKDLDGTF